MTLWRAFVLSVALHAAPFVLVWIFHANMDTGGLAQPPVSALQARIFTYENGQVHDSAPVSVTRVAVSEAAASAQTLPADVPQPPKAAQVVPAAPADSIANADSLDVSPTVLSSVTLEYPVAANNREGVVTLAIVVAGDGRVEDVSVLKATPPGFFEAAAIAGFKSARFSPGLLGGVGVKSRMVVEVEFMPLNRGGAVSGQR